jgi:hypothetical protein
MGHRVSRSFDRHAPAAALFRQKRLKSPPQAMIWQQSREKLALYCPQQTATVLTNST